MLAQAPSMPKKPIMRIVLRLVVPIALMIGAGAALAQERQWSGGTGDGTSYLQYGTPESDDVVIALSCEAGGGDIAVFVADLGENPPAVGSDVRLLLSANGATAEAPARTIPNEEAGTVSAEARLGAASVAPLLVGGAGDLGIVAADSTQSVPLAGIGAKAERFLAACSGT